MKISFSYVEILMEEIFDLLVPRNVSKKLDVRTNVAGENVIPDLTKMSISSASEFEALYQSAALTRKTASTKLNSNSSRSHAILTIYVETSDLQSQETFLGKICLVDLAGSEDNNLTGNDPTRMRESAAINRSLTTLGSVVEALNSKASRIPYRDSKLTRILQDALGGSSIGMLICNLAPGDKFAKEALRTLKFATRTREIENKPVVNAKVTSAPRASRICPSVAILPRSVCQSQPTELNKAIAMEINKSGLGMTEEELETRIQNIVKSMIASNTRIEQAPQEATEVVKEVIQSFEGYTEDERKARAKVLINLARTHHDKGELELSLEYYRKAKVYVPDNQKLSKRIAEIELASMGEIPLPLRSGSSKLPEVVHPRIETDPHGTSPLLVPIPPPVVALQDSNAKNLNLASLLPASASEGKNGDRQMNVKLVFVSKHSAGVCTSGPTVLQGYVRNMDVYRDPLYKAAAPATLLLDKDPRRLAAARAKERNHQLACDDSEVTEIDMLDFDEYVPQQDLSRSIKRRRG
ncbi:hypothetical protein QFC22_002842 [Naganishia vaughanmartiniae]|uniref:Uncharacterized protein n=1 Tax=Naganishia vaughanmartiniae TaxID=1424756 RepID=A0ACC2XAF9_9TREE|nr:hypothetical protein QFC22_002842 [Naganishia vaughanmartiniae]